MTTENEEDGASEVVKKLRHKLGILQNIFYALGQIPVKAAEAKKAAELVDYMDSLVVAAQNDLNSQIATEALGKPVKVDGSTLTAVEKH